MNQEVETIVALATPMGTAAIALVRVSGPLCRVWAAGELFGRGLQPRRAHHLDFRNREGECVDDVVVVWYAAPASYTGEDGLEISCHGNPFIVRRLIEDLCARGARPALPGEFTQRAFLSGRLDLSQAEAVMDIIQARSDRALKVAQQQLKGSLGRHLAPLQQTLLDAAARVEAYIDFPEEDLPPEDRSRVQTELQSVLRGTQRLLATRHFGQLMRDGIRTVIMGAPNVGKSSLLNRLVGFDRALVSPEPGTTRDFLEEWIQVGPHALRLIDTAGLNPSPGGDIERRGMELTREQAAQADLVLWVVDASESSPALPPPEVRSLLTVDKVVLVGNKLDRIQHSGTETKEMGESVQSRLRQTWRAAELDDRGPDHVVLVSAATGEGLEGLVATIVALADAFQPELGDEIIAVSLRHAQALDRVRSCVQQALEQLQPEGLQATELLASDIRGALEALGEISGKYDHERMLDRLFATFCIGK